jgi:hypothetical protein
VCRGGHRGVTPTCHAADLHVRPACYTLKVFNAVSNGNLTHCAVRVSQLLPVAEAVTI